MVVIMTMKPAMRLSTRLPRVTMTEKVLVRGPDRMDMVHFSARG